MLALVLASSGCQRQVADKAFPQPVLARFPLWDNPPPHTYAAEIAVVQEDGVRLLFAHILKPPEDPRVDFYVKTPVKNDESVSLKLNNSDTSGEIGVGQWAYFYGQLPIGITPTVVGAGESSISSEPDTAEFLMHVIAGALGASNTHRVINVSDQDYETVTVKCRSSGSLLATLKRGEYCDVNDSCVPTVPVQYSTVPEVNKWVMDILKLLR